MTIGVYLRFETTLFHAQEVQNVDKNAVGKEMGPFAYLTWERKIGQFIGASGDRNPFYVDEDFAKKSEYGGVIAPLAMANAYISPMVWSIVDVCKIDRAKLLHGDQEYEFIKPVRASTLLLSYFKVVDVYEKKGLHFAAVELTTRDEDGDIAVKGKMTLVER